jgi:hypothetical protein
MTWWLMALTIRFVPKNARILAIFARECRRADDGA